MTNHACAQPSSSQPDHPLLLASQTALRLFIAIDVKLSEEAAWTEPLMNLLRAVVDSVGVRQSAIVSK